MPIIPDNLIGIFKKTADNLKGSAKRVFMGEVVSTYGYGALKLFQQMKLNVFTVKINQHTFIHN